MGIFHFLGIGCRFPGNAFCLNSALTKNGRRLFKSRYRAKRRSSFDGTTSEAQNEVNVGSRIASGSNPVVGPAAGSTQSGTAHGGPTDPPVASSAGGGTGGLDGK